MYVYNHMISFLAHAFATIQNCIDHFWFMVKINLVTLFL